MGVRARVVFMVHLTVEGGVHIDDHHRPDAFLIVTIHSLFMRTGKILS